MNMMISINDKAIEYAKRKIDMFPDLYREYVTDKELFEQLVEDCRKQVEVEMFSISMLSGGGVKYGQSVV